MRNETLETEMRWEVMDVGTRDWEGEGQNSEKKNKKWFDSSKQTWKFIIIMLIDVNFVLEWYD